ncbi:hypothetical protein G3480_21625 [Thiorhodococcus mannitoliphagus]|uniref:Iron-binding zinc finger CDGSH type domain-containing protein n=1 Tax=Thiorhodococcus mannitoliphagus TaxID=329406 RepID=A0A6P1DYW6_9GAMM|nr:CDGSH iron-sulfur domain-containing protein [Thiorhodococcus mannitoliphagus]NEX22869.1 hypothetical protein [Thiorhodococcus mannitoliphagus]
MSDKPVTHFKGEEIEVSFDSRLCIGVGECAKSAGELFVAGREPWCAPDHADKAEVREIVERCPSGALSYVDKAGHPEAAPAANEILVVYNGPYYLTGELEIEGVPEDMPGVRHRAALCRCGASKNKPFCDNSHAQAQFQDAGALGDSGPGLAGEGGPLSVRVIPDGPLKLQGNLTIKTGSGRAAWQGTGTALCRCGVSKNKPFCDGSHREAGFKSD